MRRRSIAFGILVACVGLSTGCNPLGASNDPSAGREGYLNGGGLDVLLAATADNLPEATRITMSHDTTAEQKMLTSGTGFTVADQTKAKEMESSPLGGIRVHILSGANSGRDGWVSADVLR